MYQWFHCGQRRLSLYQFVHFDHYWWQLMKTVLNRPAKWRDLNPMQNLWTIVKRKTTDTRAIRATITPQQSQRGITCRPRLNAKCHCIYIHWNTWTYFPWVHISVHTYFWLTTLHFGKKYCSLFFYPNIQINSKIIYWSQRELGRCWSSY